MKQKTTEELLIDLYDRFRVEKLDTSVEKRLIQDETYVLWFSVHADIFHDGSLRAYHGESYELNKAIGVLVKNISVDIKPDMSHRRVHIEDHGFEDMNNIVRYEKRGK